MPHEGHDEIYALLLAVVRSVVDRPDAAKVRALEHESGVTFKISVDPADMGKLIGARGRTAGAIRTILSANTRRLGRTLSIDIDQEPRETTAQTHV